MFMLQLVDDPVRYVRFTYPAYQFVEQSGRPTKFQKAKNAAIWATIMDRHNISTVVVEV